MIGLLCFFVFFVLFFSLQTNEMKVAIKSMRRNFEDHYKQIKREIKLMKASVHPNIVNYIESYSCHDHVCAVGRRGEERGSEREREGEGERKEREEEREREEREREEEGEKREEGERGGRGKRGERERVNHKTGVDCNGIL
jgi:Protein tyrosine and serine/threonine kinase